MAGISDFISGAPTSGSKIETFKKKSCGKSKQEVRKLEEEMLKPEKLKPYIGKKSFADGVKDKSCKIFFNDEEDWDLFNKYFQISVYVEPSVANIKLLIDFLHAMEEGQVNYDTKSRKFTFTDV
jgi:hypothetical protein